MKLSDEGSSCQLLNQDHLGEVYKRVPVGAYWPCGEPVEDAALILSPSTSPAPLSECPLPLASNLSPGPATSSVSASSYPSLTSPQPQEPLLPIECNLSWPLALSLPPLSSPDPMDHASPPTALSAPPLPDSVLTLSQCHSMALPISSIAQSSSPHKRWSASSIPVISVLGHSGYPISALSWWHVAARTLCLSTSTEGKGQKEHISCQPSEASFWTDTPHRQMESGSPSLINSDNQKFMGIQVTKKTEIKVWKETEKDGSFSKQTSPEYHLDSVGNMLASMGPEQDSTTPQPFWKVKEKLEQLLYPQQLSAPKILGAHNQEKYQQLFWGLPSLHSESLVAAAWISGSSSALQPALFSFNAIMNVYPVQMQAKVCPLLMQAQPLSHMKLQLQSLISPTPQFQHPLLGQAQPQSNLPSSFSTEKASSASQIRDCGASYDTSQNKPQYISQTEIQDPEWSLLEEELGNGQALPSEDQRPQEVCGLVNPKLSQENWEDSILPKNFPISDELRGQLEQHIHKWLIQHRWDLPRWIQESMELMQLQDELAETGQAKDKPRCTRTSISTGECSKNPQKVRFKLEKNPSKNLAHILGKAPKDASRGLEGSQEKVLGMLPEESQKYLNRTLRSDSENDISRSLDKNYPKNNSNVHLGTKSGQIMERITPVRVCQSGPAANKSFSMPEAQIESKNVGTSKSVDSSVGTSQELSFLNPFIQQLLDAHILRSWVKHKWGLPLRVLKPLNLFKLPKFQSESLTQFSSPSSTSSESRTNSAVDVAKILGKPPPTGLKEKLLISESTPTLEDLNLFSSSTRREIGKALTGITSADDLMPSEALPSTQLSQTLTYSSKGKIHQSETLWEAGRNSTDIPLLPQMSVSKDSEELLFKAEVASEAEHRVKRKLAKQPQAYATDEFLPDGSTNMLLSGESLPSQVPQHHLHGVPFKDMLTSQMRSDLMAARRSSMDQKHRIPKHQDSWKSQSEMHASTYKSEGYRRLNLEQHEDQFPELGTSKLTQVMEIEDIHGSENTHLQLENKEVPSETCFKQSIRQLVQLIFPKRKIPGQADPLQKSASAQSQRLVKKRSHTDSTTAEAKELMTIVGQMLEKNGIPQDDICSSKVSQHREELPTPVSKRSCCRKPHFQPEQRRPSHAAYNHQATLKCQNCPFRQKQVRDQQTLKTVRFNKESQCLRHPNLSLPSKAVSPVSPSQHGPAMPHASGHHPHCPRHCPLRGGVLSVRPEKNSPAFSSRKNTSPRKTQPM
uniref:SPATA31 domain-containing protein n=2 Tax=Oryctolagus cuniculus TaxID=9986 RepID=G1SYJ0_RABIT